MWRVVLSVCLLCCGSEGHISCKNNAGRDVDWYILYKQPGTVQFIYSDSRNSDFKKTRKLINNKDEALAKTLEPIFIDNQNVDSLPTMINHHQATQVQRLDVATAKVGLVMVDEDTVVWVLHSTPKFPKTRESNSFFPSSGVKNAQTFICVTFHKKTHLRNIRAHIFDFANTKFFSADIENFRNIWTSDDELNKKKKLYQDLRSMDGENFKGFFKKTLEKPEVGDLYVTIANTLKTNLYAQTCGGQDGRSGPYCPDGGQNVYNVESIKFSTVPDVQWNRGSDHSKWCVSEDNDWTCIADSNRAVSQFRRPGGALCIKNKGVNNAFTMLKGEYEDCHTGVGMKRKPPEIVVLPKKKQKT
ncbi:deoxyribonuclease-2-alpha-like [Anabas testudineus]|uniref:deoxyribonuclease-2-alpha-like n=1 Tax=Anabas testudineus TaxID=64144 RepID=UPI000E45AFE5|nr:deoxyribonuclease-2-alpha-like [Anabas testudineus]